MTVLTFQRQGREPTTDSANTNAAQWPPTVDGNGVREVRDPNAQPVELEVEEEAAPTDAQLAVLNQRLAAQLPGFVPLQRPFTLCISKIRVRRIWGIDRRYVMDTWLHHWKWMLRNHLIIRHRACRVWVTKVGVANFMSSHHHFEFGRPPVWTMFNLTQVRFMRVCYRLVLAPPNKVLIKIDQMHLVVPVDPDNPNSQLMLLSTAGDENQLFQQAAPAVLAGLQPDPLPVGPDGVFVEPIDPVAGTLDIGEGGTGVFVNRPIEALGMGDLTLGGNQDGPRQLNNNQLQLYCWVLEPNGTIARENFTLGGPGGAGAAPQVISLAVSPTPAIPAFEDENGVMMDNATMLTTTLTGDPNTVRLFPLGAGQARLEWDGTGQLQAAPALLGNGPPTVWTDVPGGALSPVTVSLNNPSMRYFRVRR
jgi:hypothetical protein